MSLEVFHAPVVSTAHVPEAEAKKISAAIEDGAINGMQREEGWFIHIETGISNDVIAAQMPGLHGVLTHFSQQPFEWVLFDCDAHTVEGLEVFDW